MGEPYSSDPEYAECFKCGEVAMFEDFDGSLLCMICRERFHPDFRGHVEIPDPD